METSRGGVAVNAVECGAIRPPQSRRSGLRPRRAVSGCRERRGPGVPNGAGVGGVAPTYVGGAGFGAPRRPIHGVIAPAFLSSVRSVTGFRHALHVSRPACLRDRVGRPPRLRKRSALLRPATRRLHLPTTGQTLRIRPTDAKTVTTGSASG